jgi:hypothetical protein
VAVVDTPDPGFAAGAVGSTDGAAATLLVQQLGVPFGGDAVAVLKEVAVVAVVPL